ncbi:MAG: hypothetical protein FWB75_01930 [Oscillospiraceae bacterium]|nr:hypothetical protein [Oscillospiraceae bacterium]
MTDVQQRSAAKKFATDWKDKGYEKGQSRSFWISLLCDVYGVEHPDSTFADMCGETSMLFHTSLLNEHRELDRDVMKFCGFSIKDFSKILDIRS